MAQYYTKNGSIPTTEKDDSEGWFAAPDKPTAPEGSEVVWWYPPGWVIRPVMPVKAGFKYSWSQSESKWVEHATGEVIEPTVEVIEPAVEVGAIEVEAPAEVVIPVETNDTVTLTDGSVDTVTLSSVEPTISLDLGTGSDTVTGSATPTI